MEISANVLYALVWWKKRAWMHCSKRMVREKWQTTVRRWLSSIHSYHMWTTLCINRLRHESSTTTKNRLLMLPLHSYNYTCLLSWSPISIGFRTFTEAENNMKFGYYPRKYQSHWQWNNETRFPLPPTQLAHKKHDKRIKEPLEMCIKGDPKWNCQKIYIFRRCCCYSRMMYDRLIVFNALTVGWCFRHCEQQ